MKNKPIRAALSASLSSACLAGCMSGLLGGCADPHADVLAHSDAAQWRDGATYAITQLPSRDANAERPQIDALLRDELAARGLNDAAGSTAWYLLSVAYDTRPASVRVGDAACERLASDAPGACDKPAAPVAWFGARAYRHSLTLRFFERASGDQRYKVSAVIVDRDADPLRAMPLLVKSALAKLPFDARSGWRVKLRQQTEGGAPAVVSVQPIER